MAADVPESPENLKRIYEIIGLYKLIEDLQSLYNLQVAFSADNKVMHQKSGVSSDSAKHPCPWLLGYKFRNKKTVQKNDISIVKFHDYFSVFNSK